jgi:hypothetical protein
LCVWVSPGGCIAVSLLGEGGKPFIQSVCGLGCLWTPGALFSRTVEGWLATLLAVHVCGWLCVSSPRLFLCFRCDLPFVLVSVWPARRCAAGCQRQRVRVFWHICVFDCVCDEPCPDASPPAPAAASDQDGSASFGYLIVFRLHCIIALVISASLHRCVPMCVCLYVCVGCACAAHAAASVAPPVSAGGQRVRCKSLWLCQSPRGEDDSPQDLAEVPPAHVWRGWVGDNGWGGKVCGYSFALGQRWFPLFGRRVDRW